MSKISLRAARININMSIEQLADEAKISRESLYLYESGKRMPRFDTVQSIWQVFANHGLDIRLEDIFIPQTSQITNT